MAIQPIAEDDLGRGIDAFHPEHKIPPGFIEDARNFDPTAEGTLRKRTGYQMFAGFVPFRVVTVSRSNGTHLDFDLDLPTGALADYRSSPLVIAGRLAHGAASTAGGYNETTIASRHFDGFTIVTSTSVRVASAGANFAARNFEGCVWGLDPARLAVSAALNIDHLDYFKNSSVQHPVCGFRGVFYAGKAIPDPDDCPSGPPNLALTIPSTTVVAPLFWGTGEVSGRTRGFITCDSANSNMVHGHSVSYNAGTGFVEYVVSTPGRVISGALGTVVTGSKDRLTIRGAPHSSLNGDFVIRNLTAPTADTLMFSVENPNVDFTTAATLPDTSGGVDFYAGVFTDSVPTSTRAFLGSILSGPAVPESVIWEVIAVPIGVSPFYISGASTEVSIPAASILDQTVTTSAVPLTSASIVNWVRGDCPFIGSLAASRRVRVQNVLPIADSVITVTGDGETASFSDGPYTYLSVGDRIVIIGSGDGDLDGSPKIVTDIVGPMVSFASTFVGTTGSVTLLGYMLGLSESVELSSDDNVGDTIDVVERWIPIEGVPRANTAVPNQTYTTYYTKDDTPDASPAFKFRSALVAESMYLTNYANIVYKYDGQYLSAAGLPRWQPLIGMAPMANRFSRVLNDDRARDVNEATPPNDGSFALTTPGDGADLDPDMQISYSVRVAEMVREQDFVVRSVSTAANETGGNAAVVRAAPPVLQTFTHATAGDVIIRALTRRYYYAMYRLDTNYRVQVSQPASIEDAVVRFGGIAPGTAKEAGKPGARIDALIAKPPLYRLFDYRHVEVQSNISLGRDGTPVFALGVILPINYTPTLQSALSTIQDAATVDSLGLRSRDNTAKTVLDQLFFTEQGKAPALKAVIDRPPRGKAMSTAASRLIVGNLRAPARVTLAGVIPDDRPITATNIQNRIKLRKGSTTYTFYTYLATMAANVLSNCVVDGTDADSGLYIHLSAPAPVVLLTGMWIQIAGPAESPRLGQYSMELLGWYQIVDPAPAGYTANTIKVRAPVRRPLAISLVTPGTDTFTTATDHQLNIGDPVILRNVNGGTGALPTDTVGVMSGQFYAIPITDTTFKLATSYVNAVTNSPTDVLTTGAAVTAHFVESVPGGVGLRIGFPDTSTITTVPVLVWDLDARTNPDYVAGDSRIRMLDNKEVSKRAVVSVMIKDLGRAINAVASGLSVSGTAPFVYCAELGNDAAVPNSVELEALDPADDFDVAIDYPTTGSATTSMPEWYINNTLAADDAFVAAPQTVFPSRIARSYQNFPEVFGSPFLIDSRLSDSAIDIGEDDGDEVTAIISRFGESFSNAALGQGAVIVFKRRAVYLVDVNTKQVAQIETNGQGCPFPRSVIRTKNGILFANTAGLWKINESNQCVYLGQILKRYWERGVNHDDSVVSDVICGHHDAQRNRAMVSVPIAGELVNDEVAVYDHTRESGDDRGAWTIYGNFAATGWCNAGADSLFGTTAGAVFALRRAFDNSDYQDDADPIGGYDIDGTSRGAYANLAEKGFGAGGIRKRVTYVQVGFREDDGASVTVGDPVELSAAVDHSMVFKALDTFKIVDPHAAVEDNLSGMRRGHVTTLQFSLPIPKAEYVQLRIFDDTAMRPVEITDVTYLVEALQPAGVPSAAGTR